MPICFFKQGVLRMWKMLLKPHWQRGVRKGLLHLVRCWKCRIHTSEDGIHSPRLQVQRQDWPLLWGLFHAGSVTVTSVLYPKCSVSHRGTQFSSKIFFVPCMLPSRLRPKFSLPVYYWLLPFCFKTASSVLNLPHFWGPARTSGVLTLVTTERPAPVTGSRGMAQWGHTRVWEQEEAKGIQWECAWNYSLFVKKPVKNCSNTQHRGWH